MVNQTFRFYGIAYSGSGSAVVTAEFNGVQIHSGPVITQHSLPDSSQQSYLLFEYTCPIDVAGQIPFSLSVTSGWVWFGHVHANYRGGQFELDESIPDSPVVKVIVAPEDYYGPVMHSGIESDGKINVTINGVNQFRDLEQYPDRTGDWRYQILEYETFLCEITVEPELIRNVVPTVEQMIARRNQLAADSE